MLEDPDQGNRIPERGFVLTRLSAALLIPDEADPHELAFEYAVCDEPEPLLDPNDALRDNDEGWAAFPRMSRGRYSVFIAERPLYPPAGSRLQLKLKHNKGDGALAAMLIRRSRYAISASEEWSELMDDENFRSQRAELHAAQKQREEIPGVTMPVMLEEPTNLTRDTFRFVRGVWLNRAEQVEADVPDLFPPLPDNTTANRLTLARWLVSPENPLTARVTVNRFWEQLFGRGLVETVEDFGPTGTPPSHSALLDHLAFDFQQDWNVRNLLRTVVLSATYRQDATTTAELLQKDPRNQLLTRGPRNRLTAEMLRDQALLVSGLLSRKQFGPPVMPPQPEGVWRSVYNNERWETSPGENRHRRAVYTFWKRTSAYPTFMMFDAPSREVCTDRRITTNTPLQALATLNDPVFLECAQSLADRCLKEGGTTPAEQLSWAFTTTAGTRPDETILPELEDLYSEALQHFDANPTAAQPLGETRERFALTVAANAILNLDLVLTK